MQTIAIDDEWVKTAQLFGDMESVVKEALKFYSIEQCQQRIQKSAAKVAEYSQKYQCDYEHFKYAVQTDENFLKRVEAQYPLWEEDAMEWEYWSEENQTWQSRLEVILKR
jgi:hypothetical protein